MESNNEFASGRTCCVVCAVNLCSTCILLGRSCHLLERGRNTCSTHTRECKTIKVHASRAVAVGANFKHGSFLNAVHSNHFPKNNPYNLFKNFYTEMNNNAHYFEIFDAGDVDLWFQTFPFKGLFIFTTRELAVLATQVFQDLSLVLNLIDSSYQATDHEGMVHARICSQCNSYQAHFPYFRQLRVSTDVYVAPQNNYSLSFTPNFYSESLCRKSNVSHEKKKKGGRRISKYQSAEKDDLRNSQEEENSKAIYIDESNMTIQMQQNLIQNSNSSSNIIQNNISSLLNQRVWARDPSALQTSVNESVSNFLGGFRMFSKAKASSANEFNSIENSGNFSSTKRRKLSLPSSLEITSETPSSRANQVMSQLSACSEFESSADFPEEHKLKDAVALTLLESRKFKLFRSYLNLFPVDYNENPVKYCRFEFLKMLSYLAELASLELYNAKTCLPVLNGNVVNTKQLFYFPAQVVQNVSADSVVEEMGKFDASLYDTNDDYMTARSSLLVGFGTAYQLLLPYVLTRDSSVGKIEPILSIAFEYTKTVIVHASNYEYSRESYENVLNLLLKALLNNYVFYEEIMLQNPTASLIIALKHLLIMIFRLVACISVRTRLVSERARYTIRAFESLEKEDSRNCEWFKTTKSFAMSSFESMRSTVFPEDFKYIKASSIYGIALNLCLNSVHTISVNTRNICSCICDLIGLRCIHTTLKSSYEFSTSSDFSLPSLAVLLFLQLGFDNFEELHTISYCKFLCNLMSVACEKTHSDNSERISITELSDNLCLSNADHNVSNFMSPVFQSSTMNHIVLISSNYDLRGTTPITITDTAVNKYLNFLEVEDACTSSNCSIDEGIRWFVLASKLAFISNDVYSIVHSGWVLSLSYFIWKRDYSRGVEQAEKLISFCKSTLLHLPLESKYIQERRICQEIVLRSRSLLIQYSQHVKAGILSPFLPGQVIQVKIAGKFEDVIYITFEHTSKPLFLSNLDFCGGDSWSVIGSDLSVSTSWRSVCLETYYSQVGSLYNPSICQTYILHLFRTSEYSVNNFKRDIILRGRL